MATAGNSENEESRAIAARIATASEVFPIVKAEDWDSTVHVSAEGAVITAVVTDPKGQARREYRATLQLVDKVAHTGS